jgi:spore coat polysaccharide biosynthesis protein SpsF
MKKRSEQELFWENEFGENYIDRNLGNELLAANISFFARALKLAGNINSLIEFGANVGMNIHAIRELYPQLNKIAGIEINPIAARKLESIYSDINVFNGSILEYSPSLNNQYDIALIKTVLIHINPDDLQQVYQRLYDSTNKYILVCEYYNTSPVTVNYRGHSNKLFKRDFAGELLEKFSNLELVDYGFVYHNEMGPVNSLIDDITWFLLKKKING